MPEEEVEWKPRAELLTFEEILRLAKVFSDLGVRKIRLTGGEPTLRKGLCDLIGKLRESLPAVELHLTTNGLTLSKQAASFKQVGLDGVNISLDSLKRERFLEITRRDCLAEVLGGVDAAVESGLRTKINVVVMPGLNSDELCDFVDYFWEMPVDIRFIEFMPFLGNLWQADRVFGYREMLAALAAKFELLPRVRHQGAVAKEFTINGAAVGVGFITSMTDSFCADCNRIRLTCDGKFKTCLFLPPQTSLRDLMRTGASDAEIVDAVRTDLNKKWAGHPPMGKWRQLDTLSMVQIGG